MATRMKHKTHGYLIAYGPADIERLTGLGWELDAPAPKVAPSSKSSSKRRQHEGFYFPDLIGHKEKE